MTQMKKIRISLFGLTILALSGCSTSWLSGYRPPIQQGNEVKPAQFEQLKTGMSEAQVRFILGEPLLTDAFNPNRWDYAYALTPTYGRQTVKRLTLYFQGGKLARIVGGPTAMPEHQKSPN